MNVQENFQKTSKSGHVVLENNTKSAIFPNTISTNKTGKWINMPDG